MDRLDAMRTFVAVVAEGSFTKAADRLSMSPQLVSKYVSQLEEHLGLRLLNRTTRRVHPTEAGSRYQARAMQLLEELDELENQLGDYRRSARGVLRISAPVSFGTSHLPGLLQAFQREHPAVGIDLRLDDSKVDIVEEGFDIALRIGKLKSSSLIAKPLAPIRIVTCAAPLYLKQQGTPKTLDDLKGHRYLRYSYMDNSDNEVHQALNVAATTTTGFTCNNGDVLLQAAIAGAGIIIQPTFIAGPAIANKQLKIILPAHEPEPLGLYAVYAHRKFLASKVRAFIDFAANFFAQPPSWEC
ncbi:LysR family transcriptional regulator [Gilvimarinus xylanilyticus]|uniref:LysR family transcriptional regulator n=1 Tax=Gilvimarinus xylanilyticus TaxID=2944139 RepID=A0A9X2KRC0_9GAMM|nr:LysR family transcriptional regulator [Gilvimarinus xylanilyticus]MCP8897686.1 LysR family transcriptional regulator [Gilvimarinus xylanilyticus]